MGGFDLVVYVGSLFNLMHGYLFIVRNVCVLDCRFSLLSDCVFRDL